MAKATGFICDRPDCGAFQATTETDPPPGWIVVRPYVPRDGQPSKSQSAGEILVCGNRCLKMVASDRAKAEKPERKGGTSGYSIGQLRYHHARGTHDGDPRDGCPDCEAATAPGDAA